MAQYKCENCNELRDSVICPKCGADTHLVDGPLPSIDATRGSRNIAAAEPEKPTPEPLREPIRSAQTSSKPPRPRPVPVPEPKPSIPYDTGDGPEPQPQPREPQPSTSGNIANLATFHAILDRGTKAIIICGDSFVGKSHIVAGYIRANDLYRGKAQNLNIPAKEFAIGATNPGEVWYQVIDHQRAFLDPSGEFFKRLSRDERQRLGLADVSEDDFRFVQRSVAVLAGVVLVVDLTKAVDLRQSSPWRRQEEDLKFVLSALRWLRWDKEARPQTIGVSDNISQRVSTLPRIDKRVLVLFSKADRVVRFSTQTPFAFARKQLPTLHGALMTHARRFRYDFCNTMIKIENGTDEATNPCGVLLPMEWLLDDPFRWLPLQLPTSWIGGGR